MSNKLIVGYDGSPASRRAVDFALEEAKCRGATLLIAYILEWSPYSFLTPTELEERHVRRTEEMERAKTAVVEPLLEEISTADVKVKTVIQYGNTGETLCKLAEDENASQIVIGKTGDGSVVSRVFGSAAISVAQSSSVPCTLVP